MNFKLTLIVAIFFLGLYFCLNYKSSDIIEGYNNNQTNCPNLLIKKGKELHLVNTKKSLIPGVNPIRFNSLEDYAEYIEWAQRVGIKCPILYYEQTYDTQNNKGFRMLNDPLNPNAGLASNPSYMKPPLTLLTDSNRDDPPYNSNNYSSFDPYNQEVGNNTPLDNITLKTDNGSLSAMDDDWCGGKCSQKAVDNGKFSKRTRKILDPIDSKQLKSVRNLDSEKLTSEIQNQLQSHNQAQIEFQERAKTQALELNNDNNFPPGPQHLNKRKLELVYTPNTIANTKCTNDCSVEFERCAAEHGYNKCREGINNNGNGSLKNKGCIEYCLDTINMSNLRQSNTDSLKIHTSNDPNKEKRSQDHHHHPCTSNNLIVTDPAVSIYPIAAHIDPTSSNANPAAANTKLQTPANENADITSTTTNQNTLIQNNCPKK